MFTDRAVITVSSGKGGDGHVSFRREKYVPAGGPDGGDGGKGGDVIFVVDKGLNTLTDYRHVRTYSAENGEDGKKKRMAGRQGADLILKVPEGTVIKEASTGRVIADMSGENQRFTLYKGGRGGNGNQHYATSTMQAPRYAQPGQPARTMEVLLELKVIADVGLLGYPNVGKSTLLSHVSNARPKIANYHFTTLTPNLGVVDLGEGRGFVMADIPGLIEGAAEGAGLGHEFLAHLERTRLLIHVVDASGSEGRDPVADYRQINAELSAYKVDLTDRPQIVAANKMDLLPPEEQAEALAKLKEALGDVPIYPISAVSGQGLKELLNAADEMLSKLPKGTVVFEPEFEPEKEQQFISEEISVRYDPKDKTWYVEGDKVDRMLGYTNLDTERGFLFFQRFLRDNGIIASLEKAGIEEGALVDVGGHVFEFYEDGNEPPLTEEEIDDGTDE